MSTNPDLMQILDSPDLVSVYKHLRTRRSDELAMELILLFKQVKSLEGHVEILGEELVRVRADVSRTQKGQLRE